MAKHDDATTTKMMHYAVIRNYSGQGVKELVDFVEQNETDLEKAMSDIPGFVSYVAIRTGSDTATTVTVCQDEQGLDASVTAAGAWIKKNAPDFGTSPPQVWKGQVVAKA